MKKHVGLRIFALLLAVLLCRPALPVFANDGFTYLESMTPVESDRYTGNLGDSFIGRIGTRNGVVDTTGAKFDHGLEVWIARWNYTPETSWVWATYDLGGKYSLLEGTVSVIAEGLLGYNASDFRTTLEFIADGKSLYKTDVTPETGQLPFALDVTGVRSLKISAYDQGSYTGGTTIALGDIRLSAGTVSAFGNIPREWTGEYDGKHSDGTVVRREIEIHILNITENGEINGTAIFAPSEKADAAYGANGSYYFKGTITPRTDADQTYGIEMQGTDWIEYPSSFDNWTFVYLSGTISLSRPAVIDGKSENGIWAMTAIDYGSIHSLSGFTLGRDNNHYVHHDGAGVDGAGFVGQKNYRLDDAYYQKLTQNSTDGEKNQIKKRMSEEWGGSCYGIAMSMGLLYEGYISSADLSGSGNSYYALGKPCSDRKFMNMVNYFQLSQYLEAGGKQSAAVSVTYDNTLLGGLSRWRNAGYDSLPVFLRKLVNSCADNHVSLLGYAMSGSGHAVLVTGCSFDEADGQFHVQVYDENIIRSGSDTGSFLTMTVAKDFSKFSFTDANGEQVNNYSFLNMFFLDWNALGSVVAPVSSGYTRRTRISFPDNTSFCLTNQNGETLRYKDGKLSGDMEVLGVDSLGSDNRTEIVIDVAEDSVYTLTEAGQNLAVEITGEDAYASLDAAGLTGATIDLDKGMTLKGSDYAFRAFLTTGGTQAEKGLTSVAAKAGSDVDLRVSGQEVKVVSNAPVSDLTTAVYTGADETAHHYAAAPAQFTVNGAAAVPEAGEQPAAGGNEPRTGNDIHFPRTKIYRQGQFRDVKTTDWFDKSVGEAYELGLMVGMKDDLFDPQGKVTIAQAITMAARIRWIYENEEGVLSNAQGSDWYEPYVAYALEKGILVLSLLNEDINRAATRTEFAMIFARAFPDEALAAIGSVPDDSIPDVKMTYANAADIYKLYRAGILGGSDAKGTFHPHTNITRAEAAAVVSRMADSDNRLTVRLP